MQGNLHVRFGERDGETSLCEGVWRSIPTLLQEHRSVDLSKVGGPASDWRLGRAARVIRLQAEAGRGRAAVRPR